MVIQGYCPVFASISKMKEMMHYRQNVTEKYLYQLVGLIPYGEVLELVADYNYMLADADHNTAGNRAAFAKKVKAIMQYIDDDKIVGDLDFVQMTVGF